MFCFPGEGDSTVTGLFQHYLSHTHGISASGSLPCPLPFSSTQWFAALEGDSTNQGVGLGTQASYISVFRQQRGAA